MTVELAAQEIIEHLLKPPKRGARSAGRARRELAVEEKRIRDKRCACGGCRSCQEAARWERIYRDRFEDPTYYEGPAVRFSSPLESL